MLMSNPAACPLCGIPLDPSDRATRADYGDALIGALPTGVCVDCAEATVRCAGCDVWMPKDAALFDATGAPLCGDCWRTPDWPAEEAFVHRHSVGVRFGSRD